MSWVFIDELTKQRERRDKEILYGRAGETDSLYRRRWTWETSHAGGGPRSFRGQASGRRSLPSQRHGHKTFKSSSADMIPLKVFLGIKSLKVLLRIKNLKAFSWMKELFNA